jgi:hypothetical protein
MVLRIMTLYYPGFYMERMRQVTKLRIGSLCPSCGSTGYKIHQKHHVSVCIWLKYFVCAPNHLGNATVRMLRYELCQNLTTLLSENSKPMWNGGWVTVVMLRVVFKYCWCRSWVAGFLVLKAKMGICMVWIEYLWMKVIFLFCNLIYIVY